MPAYNFKGQFADAIRSGAKRCTIRPPRARGHNPEVGKRISLYTGLRTKRARKIVDPDPVVVRLQRIEIDPTGHRVMVLIEHGRGAAYSTVWEPLNVIEVAAVAIEDGFAGSLDFFSFFREQYGPEAREYLWIKWAPHG